MAALDTKVYFENNIKTFRPGDEISGTVEVSIEVPQHLEVVINFKGEAFTKWSKQKEKLFKRFYKNVMEEDRGLKSSRQFFRDSDINNEHNMKPRQLRRSILKRLNSGNEIISGREKYFDDSIKIRGRYTRNLGSSNPLETMKFAFKFKLPERVPSSYEGRFGFVRYSMKVLVTTPDDVFMITKVPFTVVTPLNLNEYPRARKNLHIQMEKRLGFVCKSLPLTIDVHAPTTGYCSGDSIPLVVEVDNRTRVSVHWVRAYFRKVITYRGLDKAGLQMSKKAAMALSAVEHGPAAEGEFTHWTMRLPVPDSIPPSNLLYCNIIDVDYDILVEVKLAGMHKNITDGRYVLIGTVPIAPSLSKNPSHEEEVDLEGRFED